MIGQNKLQNTFNNFTLNTLPHTMLFIGKYGCGKRALSHIIADNLHLTYLEISDKINYDVIESINNIIEPTLCVIDNKNISEKEEAALLKLVEEPPVDIFIVITAENSVSVLDTIYNRCQVFNFSSYTKDELMQFTDTNDELLFKVADTPGKIIEYSKTPLKDMSVLVNTIYDKISIANMANILTISDRIDFTGNEKFPIGVFSELLLSNVVDRVKSNKAEACDQYNITQKYYNNLFIPNINKKQLFEHYLYELKGIKANG